MISIIDYGMGNLMSLKNSLEYIGKKVEITKSEKEINNSDYIILPGVGSFSLAMKNIKNYGLDKIILNQVNTFKNLYWGFVLGCSYLQITGKKTEEQKG